MEHEDTLQKILDLQRIFQKEHGWPVDKDDELIVFLANT